MSEILGGIVAKAREAVKDGTGFALTVVGAGISASLAEIVRSWLPEQTKGVSDETVASVASFLLFYYGDKIHPRLVPIGFGAFMDSIGAWSSAYTKGIIDMLKKK